MREERDEGGERRGRENSHVMSRLDGWVTVT